MKLMQALVQPVQHEFRRRMALPKHSYADIVDRLAAGRALRDGVGRDVANDCPEDYFGCARRTLVTHQGTHCRETIIPRAA